MLRSVQLVVFTLSLLLRSVYLIAEVQLDTAIYPSHEDLQAALETHTNRDSDVNAYSSVFYDAAGGQSAIKFPALSSSVNPEELGSFLEGDIFLPLSTTDRWIRNAVMEPTLRWTNGIVPYEIARDFSTFQRTRIIDAFEEFHKRTCIRFVPHTTETDYLSIESHDEFCWSHVGRRGGRQVTNLGPTCLFRIGTTIHELMHVLGFWHEQNRPDRDEFIAVKVGNIENNLKSNFKKNSVSDTFHVPYDFASVMHYSSRAFSASGKVTIKPKPPYRSQAKVMGQREGFSTFDVEKLNRMYCGYKETPLPAGPARILYPESERHFQLPWYLNFFRLY